MHRTILLGSLLFLFSFSSGAASKTATAAAGKALDDWHRAAAEFNEEKYFSLMTDDAVFLGTDPKERWTKAEFRAYAHPVFSKGKGWSIESVKRNIFFSPDAKTAWFDEDAQSRELGPVRGSGVLVLVKGAWRVAQYNLSVPIPNDKFDEARKLIETKKPATP